jgi:Mg-chelatase subunit ChlD
MISSIELELYPNDSFYIGKIKINDDLIKESSSFLDLETIIILDRSGSMGSTTYDIVKKILPKFFQKLGYSEKEKINLITFSQFTEQFEGNYEEISKSNVSCLKETFLLPALRKLYSLIDYSKKKKFRILTISDGMLNDQFESMNYSNSIYDLIKKNKF